MNFLDWNPEKDTDLKSKEIDLHDEYHKTLASEMSTEKKVFEGRQFRIKNLEYALRLIKRNRIEGKTLEIGAGNAWCSAYVLKHHDPSETSIMEINDSAVKVLIPTVLKTVKVDQKNINIIKGSFNNIQAENEYDYVFAMGAIHHSENLGQTLKEIYKSLKPGGYFIAQEPSMPDDTQNSFYEKRNETVQSFKGIVSVKNEERSDIFYRRAEYYTAGYHAGFNMTIEDAVQDYSQPLAIMKKQLKIMLGMKPRPKTKNLVIVAQKPEQDVKFPTPTSW